ncbi:MAG: hypothetical protein ACUVSX_13600 [Aggregatilineales bacterium]
MTEKAGLRWLDGRGWIALAGTANDPVRARALSIAAADGGVAYVALRDAAYPEQLMLDMDDLGAPAGYLVNVHTEQPGIVVRQLSEASIVVIGDLADAETLSAALAGAAETGMRAAFERGAVVLAEGAGAAALGAWIAAADGELIPALGWLENALILPGIVTAGQSPAARQALEGRQIGLAVGVGAGSALALGPDGELEAWGSGQVTIVVGMRGAD